MHEEVDRYSVTIDRDVTGVTTTMHRSSMTDY
jgi:hypothetical protein